MFLHILTFFILNGALGGNLLSLPVQHNNIGPSKIGILQKSSINLDDPRRNKIPDVSKRLEQRRRTTITTGVFPEEWYEQCVYWINSMRAREGIA